MSKHSKPNCVPGVLRVGPDVEDRHIAHRGRDGGVVPAATLRRVRERAHEADRGGKRARWL